jgi:hypothetical protein
VLVVATEDHGGIIFQLFTKKSLGNLSTHLFTVRLPFFASFKFSTVSFGIALSLLWQSGKVLMTLNGEVPYSGGSRPSKPAESLGVDRDSRTVALFALWSSHIPNASLSHSLVLLKADCRLWHPICLIYFNVHLQNPYLNRYSRLTE